MSEVAAVYTTLPDPRTAESIMNLDKDQSNVHKLRAPSRNKRVWASVERTQEQVIREAFEEALKRDPEQKRQWGRCSRWGTASIKPHRKGYETKAGQGNDHDGFHPCP